MCNSWRCVKEMLRLMRHGVVLTLILYLSRISNIHVNVIMVLAKQTSLFFHICISLCQFSQTLSWKNPKQKKNAQTQLSYKNLTTFCYTSNIWMFWWIYSESYCRKIKHHDSMYCQIDQIAWIIYTYSSPGYSNPEFVSKNKSGNTRVTCYATCMHIQRCSHRMINVFIVLHNEIRV